MAKFVTWLQIYQIYGRKPVDEVHVILRRYNSSYIILEDSICMQPTTNQCGTPTLIDMYNGVVSDQHWPADPGLVSMWLCTVLLCVFTGLLHVHVVRIIPAESSCNTS